MSRTIGFGSSGSGATSTLLVSTAPVRARPTAPASTLPRIAFVHTVRGTAKTRGAAFTYQSAASAARLAMASSRVSAQNTNVNTARCAFANVPTGLVDAASPASYSDSIVASTDVGESSVVHRM